jgi:H+/Cl- antiporter ClcA
MKFEELKEEFSVQFLVLVIVIGLASGLLTYAISFAEHICHYIFKLSGWATYVYIPAMFVITVYLLKKYFPYADGSGLPQGYAVDIFDEYRLNKTYSFRSAIGKALLTFMSIAGGASLGKEGPTIQICSSLFAQMKNISVVKQRLLIKLGAGVGVAAAFNAPIGGMVFAIEEYVKKISPKIATILVGGTLGAVFISNLLTGNQPYMGQVSPTQLQHSWHHIPFAILIGSLCGLSGALFTKAIVFMTVNKTWFFNSWRKKHYLINALIFGLIVAFIGHLSSGLSFGNGAGSTTQFLDSSTDAPWYYAIAKFFGAIASVSAGVPGGYFSTALSIGAGIGDLVHHFFNTIPLVQFYLLGMAGFLAAITQSPITAVAMVVEMSGSSQFSLPILLSCFVASIISEQFGDSVYHQQVLNYIDPSRYKETL